MKTTSLTVKQCDIQQKMQNGDGPPCKNCQAFRAVGHPRHQCYANAGNAQFEPASSKPKHSNSNSNRNRNYRPRIPRNAFGEQQWMPFMPTGYAPTAAFSPRLPPHGYWNPLQQPTPQQMYQQMPQAQQQQQTQRELNDISNMLSQNPALRNCFEAFVDQQVRSRQSLHTGGRITDVERESQDRRPALRDRADRNERESEDPPTVHRSSVAATRA